jgi:NAD(P)H-hydrate epimerase
MEKADVLALGPGIGTYRETVELIARIVREATIPVVIDADGLNSLAVDPSPLQDMKAEVVLTPHPGELSRLLGTSISEIISDPISAAKKATERFDAVVVLKGAPTVTATRDGMIYVNSSGNAGMATGGSGDVLTGIIASLIGQGLSVSDAAWSGVFVHGLAGDLTLEAKGEMGMIAGDVLEAIPRALRSL